MVTAKKRCNHCDDNEIVDDCTCYLSFVHGVNPCPGNFSAPSWFAACTLTSPPASTNYLLCSSGHVVLRKGDTYYYHRGRGTQEVRDKKVSTIKKLSDLGLSGTVKYK